MSLFDNCKKEYLPLKSRLSLFLRALRDFIWMGFRRKIPTYVMDEDEDGNILHTGKWTLEPFSLRDNVETAWSEVDTALRGYVYSVL